MKKVIRLYEVSFSHKYYGKNWSASCVAVRGFALAAIKKALSWEGSDRRNLRVEEVRLIGMEK